MSFGLGRDCDADLVKKIAEAGNGTHTLTDDRSTTLNGDVIRALGFAMQPTLYDAQFGFNGEMSAIQNYGRNNLIAVTKVIPVEQLEDVRFEFRAVDSESGKELDMRFGRGDFRQVDGEEGESLVKLGIFKEMQNKPKAEKKALSLKHQIVCRGSDTAMIGVLKLRHRVTGDLIEAMDIKFSADAPPKPIEPLIPAPN